MNLYSLLFIFSVSFNLNNVRSFCDFSKFKKIKDIYTYKSVARRKYKDSMNYTGYVQDHHMIPKQWRNHTLLEILDYDINSSKNLIIMPNKKGIEKLNLHPDYLVHDGGHVPYNKYVKKQLDYILKNDEFDAKKYLFWLFLCHIKKNMKYNEDNIPWK